MAAFVRTKTGFLNVEQIHEIRDVNGVSYATTGVSPEVLLAEGWEGTLCEIIPVQGDWVALTAYVLEAGTLEIRRTPIIAWALNFEGYITPVTASDRGGIHGERAWQRVGDEMVYVPEQEPYASDEEWARNHLGLQF